MESKAHQENMWYSQKDLPDFEHHIQKERRQVANPSPLLSYSLYVTGSYR